MTEESDYIRYAEAAKYLGIGVSTLYSMVHLRKVPHIRVGKRLVLFSRTALEQWVKSHSVEGK